MSKYRLFNMSILKAKAQEGQAEGNLYVAATLENQDCVFEENTSIVMFGVNGLINTIRPYLDTQHGGIAETSNEDAIPERYRFLNGIFVRQKLEHGMSYLLNNDRSQRLDKTTGQPITMDSVLVFCILADTKPKVDGTPNYAKNWDPVSRVRSIERQFFKPISNQTATVAGNTAPQPAPSQATPAPDPLAAATAQPNTATQQPAPQPNVAQPAPQPNVVQPAPQQPAAAAPGSVPPTTGPATF